MNLILIGYNPKGLNRQNIDFKVYQTLKTLFNSVSFLIKGLKGLCQRKKIWFVSYSSFLSPDNGQRTGFYFDPS